MTTADENLDNAKEQVDKAISSLSEIVVNQCWGWDEFRKEYRIKIREIFYKLIEIKEDFDPSNLD